MEHLKLSVRYFLSHGWLLPGFHRCYHVVCLKVFFLLAIGWRYVNVIQAGVYIVCREGTSIMLCSQSTLKLILHILYDICGAPEWKTSWRHLNSPYHVMMLNWEHDAGPVVWLNHIGSIETDSFFTKTSFELLGNTKNWYYFLTPNFT